MIRYRCPHCAVLILANERRAGQSSVCKACVKPHPIPADRALWLNDLGEPLPAPAPSGPVPAVPAPVEVPEPVPTVAIVPVPAEVPAAPEPEPVHTFVPLESRAPSVPDLQLPDPLPAEPVLVEFPTPIVIVTPDPEPEPVRAAFPVPLVSTAEHEEDAEPKPTPVTIATLTPLPTPAPTFEPEPAAPAHPLPTPAATPLPRRAGRLAPVPVPAQPVSTDYSRPVQLQTQADIAVALTAALTSRMKPAAAPRRDLRPSTAAWMLLTAVGLALLVLALFSDPAYRWGAVLVGAVQIVIGYVWIVRLAWYRDPARGRLCLFPPVAAYYLSQYKYAKFRPLRFVSTGIALAVLAAWTELLSPHTQAMVRRTDPPVVQTDPATLSKLAQLRTYRDQRSYDALSKVLDLLAKTDPLLSEDKNDRAALSAELKALCEHPDTGVKVRAMAAYARWDPTGARAVCLAAVRSPSADEREWALRLLPQWKDAESARAVQSLIGRPGTVETNRAKAALEEIGGKPAEEAAIALLNRAENQGTKLTALSVLEKVGGLETATWLRANYAAATDDPVLRDHALSASEAIKARVRVPVPTP